MDIDFIVVPNTIENLVGGIPEFPFEVYGGRGHVDLDAWDSYWRMSISAYGWQGKEGLGDEGALPKLDCAMSLSIWT